MTCLQKTWRVQKILLGAMFNCRRFFKFRMFISTYGGFHSHGGTPIAGFFSGKSYHLGDDLKFWGSPRFHGNLRFCLFKEPLSLIKDSSSFSCGKKSQAVCSIPPGNFLQHNLMAGKCQKPSKNGRFMAAGVAHIVKYILMYT